VGLLLLACIVLSGVIALYPRAMPKPLLVVVEPPLDALLSKGMGSSQKENLLYPFPCHLFFEIGANVLPGGERDHLAIRISTLRHIVIFRWI
jgi:hypothetical protein